MTADPRIKYGPTITPRLGYLKMGLIGNTALSIDSASWSAENNFVHTNYAYTPVNGYKQKTLHSRGTTEISINLSGEVTLGAASVFIQLMNSLS